MFFQLAQKKTTSTSPAPTSTPNNTPITFSGVINFPDPNLKNIIRQAIGKSLGDIYASDLTGLKYLDASSSNITNITGLQCCTNLQYLNLSSNKISDINALNGLYNLQYLELYSNNISDITALVTNCNAGGLGFKDTVVLDGNPLSYQAINTDIPYLRSKGVTVF